MSMHCNGHTYMNTYMQIQLDKYIWTQKCLTVASSHYIILPKVKEIQTINSEFLYTKFILKVVVLVQCAHPQYSCSVFSEGNSIDSMPLINAKQIWQHATISSGTNTNKNQSKLSTSKLYVQLAGFQSFFWITRFEVFFVPGHEIPQLANWCCICEASPGDLCLT
jgi:hypothetical protein